MCPSINIIHVNGGNNTQKFKAFAAADIFCSLSDNIQETFGITPIEAMAAGLPVIVSDRVGCIDDLVNDEETGLIVKSDLPEALFCAMARLASYPILRSRMGEAAERLICHWTLENEASNVLAAWRYGMTL